MKINNIYYKSKKNFNSKIIYGFFTRNGGFSKGNFSSLNCSETSGEKKQIVLKNINEALKKINLNHKYLKTVSQIHSNKIIVINKKNLKNNYKADGIITKDDNICIAVLTADCCPIFLFDTDNKFIACLHAGWKGCYKNIIKNSINKIIKIQPNLNKVNAIIGPCLNKKNFEVSENFKKNFIKIDKNYKKFFNDNVVLNKSLFNMRGLIKFQLIKNNIINIEDINLDTYVNKNLFFSHRRANHLDEIPTGRMINIIGFNK